MSGLTEATASCWAISGTFPALRESSRRKPGASGIAVRLADGCEWLLGCPKHRAGSARLVGLVAEEVIEDLFERLVLDEPLPLVGIWGAARTLLCRNYELTGEELSSLLSVSPGDEARALADGVLDALFGPSSGPRGYCDWIRASLIANGLADASVSSRDLPNVLAILVATGRTVPLSRFADACRAAREQAMLETLI